MTRLVRLLVFLPLVVATACSSSLPEGDVEMSGHKFSPVTITITAGDTVTWVNHDSDTHTVTAYEDKLPEGADFFASGDAPNQEAVTDDLAAGLIERAETFEVTFDTPGRYEYFCIPHESEGMKATVVVEP